MGELHDCCCSVAKLCLTFVTPWTAACQASLSFTISWSLLKLISIELVIPSSHLILCCPLLLLHLSQHQGPLKWIGSLHQVAKVLELQLRHQNFRWIFRVDFLYDWLVWSPCYLRTLKSLLQHHSSKASISWLLAFFMVPLSHPFMVTGKTIALTIVWYVSFISISYF